MSVLWFVGDQHFHHNTPSSRIDDYPMTMLAKFKAFLEMTASDDLIILSGDFSHTPHLADWYLSLLVHLLKSYNRPHIYSIIGNHEISKSRHAQDSTLEVLMQTKLIKRLTPEPITWNGISIYGFDYLNRDIPPAPRDKGTIYVVHKFVREELDSILPAEDTLTQSDIETLAPNVLLAGHDHCIYPIVRWGRTTIVRPGGFSRGTIHHYNRIRDIFVARLDDQGVDYVKVPCLPDSEIFKKEDVPLKAISSRIQDFTSALKESRKSSHTSITSVLDSIEMPPEIRKVVLDYLARGGITLESSNLNL